MNDDSTINSAQGRMPSDEQMDLLLRDFFRREVPEKMNQPLRQNQLPTVALMEAPETRTEPLQPRSVRVIAVAMSVAAMALAVLATISVNNSSPMNSGAAANGITDAPQKTPGTDRPMLVSPQGDSRTSTQAITPDGVTLEETDSIKLHR